LSDLIKQFADVIKLSMSHTTITHKIEKLTMASLLWMDKSKPHNTRTLLVVTTTSKPSYTQAIGCTAVVETNKDTTRT
jgi:hypothetical protein